MLSHSIGTDHAMWDPQVPGLLPSFQILRYDIRGHGASDAPAGDYSIAQLGQDALSLADSLGLGKFAFCGISLGGAIGQWLASNAPARLSKLVLANTSPEFGPPANWESRRNTVLREGMVAIADMAMSRFFSPENLASSNAASVRSVLLGTDRTGYAGCCAALIDPVDAGFATRRAILGDPHVDKAIANTNDFNREFQDLITRYAWGTIWTRPGLSHRTRRLLVLATTAALGRWEEFTLHVRAGLAHELEPCDLKEVLLQTAVYAGVPAANSGFHIANGQLKGQNQEG
jgi:3-oxoadipate enol-lactonase